MSGMSYSELFRLILPETWLVLAGLVVLAVDLTLLRAHPTAWRQAWAVGLGCASLVAAWFSLPDGTPPLWALNGMLVVDPLTGLVKRILLGLTGVTLLVATRGRFTEHAGEYVALVLMGTVGMMLLVGAENIIMIFVALELTSLSLYILTAFHREDSRSAEAGLKYFLFGGMSAAVTLYGLSLLYGLSGATDLRGIAVGLSGQGLDPLLIAAMVMTITGFGFKVAAAPFHLWAPDVYEGAPVPSAALIASGSKVAGFFIFAKVMVIGFAGTEGVGDWGGFIPGWVPVIAVVAALSMVLGNLIALAQSSVRRLLAYSAVGHAGYMLLGLLAPTTEGVGPLMYYAATYGMAAVGAFAVVAVVQDVGGGDRMNHFDGLWHRAPLLSIGLAVFLLSMAGIPPLAGFFGKFYLFTAAVRSGAEGLGLLWLVVLAAAMSAVGLYYYLLVLKHVFVRPPAESGTIAVSRSSHLVVAVLALGVFLLGLSPDLLLEPLLGAVRLVAG